MPTTYSVVPDSTFLDAYANQQATSEQFSQIAAANPASPETVVAAQQVLSDLFMKGTTAADVAPDTSTDTVTVALVLNRADPSDSLNNLLSSDSEPATACAVGSNRDLVKLRRRPGDLRSRRQRRRTARRQRLPGPCPGPRLCLSVENRTIWVTLNFAQFEALFGPRCWGSSRTATVLFQAWVSNIPFPTKSSATSAGYGSSAATAFPIRQFSKYKQVDPVPVPGSDSLLGIR